MLRNKNEAPEPGRARIQRTGKAVHMFRKMLRFFLNGSSVAATANMVGIKVPGTLVAMGTKICAFVSAKLGGVLCACSSAVAMGAVGLVAVLVAGSLLSAIIA